MDVKILYMYMYMLREISQIQYIYNTKYRYIFLLMQFFSLLFTLIILRDLHNLHVKIAYIANCTSLRDFL